MYHRNRLASSRKSEQVSSEGGRVGEKGREKPRRRRQVWIGGSGPSTGLGRRGAQGLR